MFNKPGFEICGNTIWIWIRFGTAKSIKRYLKALKFPPHYTNFEPEICINQFRRTKSVDRILYIYQDFYFEAFLNLNFYYRYFLILRQKNNEGAEKMYTKLMKQIPTKHDKYKNMKTWISMKYARFQFKVCHDVDKVNTFTITSLWLFLSGLFSLHYR